MEDKRIIRTKHNLKDAMIRMLSIEDFEHISVTELCKEAKSAELRFTRITVTSNLFWTISLTICVV